MDWRTKLLNNSTPSVSIDPPKIPDDSNDPYKQQLDKELEEETKKIENEINQELMKEYKKQSIKDKLISKLPEPIKKKIEEKRREIVNKKLEKEQSKLDRLKQLFLDKIRDYAYYLEKKTEQQQKQSEVKIKTVSDIINELKQNPNVKNVYRTSRWLIVEYKNGERREYEIENIEGYEVVAGFTSPYQAYQKILNDIKRTGDLNKLFSLREAYEWARQLRYRSSKTGRIYWDWKDRDLWDDVDKWDEIREYNEIGDISKKWAEKLANAKDLIELNYLVKQARNEIINNTISRAVNWGILDYRWKDNVKLLDELDKLIPDNPKALELMVASGVLFDLNKINNLRKQIVENFANDAISAYRTAKNEKAKVLQKRVKELLNKANNSNNIADYMHYLTKAEKVNKELQKLNPNLAYSMSDIKLISNANLIGKIEEFNKTQDLTKKLNIINEIRQLPQAQVFMDKELKRIEEKLRVYEALPKTAQDYVKYFNFFTSENLKERFRFKATDEGLVVEEIKLDNPFNKENIDRTLRNIGVNPEDKSYWITVSKDGITVYQNENLFKESKKDNLIYLENTNRILDESRTDLSNYAFQQAMNNYLFFNTKPVLTEELANQDLPFDKKAKFWLEEKLDKLPIGDKEIKDTIKSQILGFSGLAIGIGKTAVDTAVGFALDVKDTFFNDKVGIMPRTTAFFKEVAKDFTTKEGGYFADLGKRLSSKDTFESGSALGELGFITFGDKVYGGTAKVSKITFDKSVDFGKFIVNDIKETLDFNKKTFKKAAGKSLAVAVSELQMKKRKAKWTTEELKERLKGSIESYLKLGDEIPLKQLIEELKKDLKLLEEQYKKGKISKQDYEKQLALFRETVMSVLFEASVSFSEMKTKQQLFIPLESDQVKVTDLKLKNKSLTKVKQEELVKSEPIELVKEISLTTQKQTTKTIQLPVELTKQKTVQTTLSDTKLKNLTLTLPLEKQKTQQKTISLVEQKQKEKEIQIPKEKEIQLPKQIRQPKIDLKLKLSEKTKEDQKLLKLDLKLKDTKISDTTTSIFKVPNFKPIEPKPNKPNRIIRKRNEEFDFFEKGENKLRRPKSKKEKSIIFAKTFNPDLWSVDKSLSLFGKATTPKPTRKMWELIEKTSWNYRPTVELLKSKKKKKKKEKLFGLF